MMGEWVKEKLCPDRDLIKLFEGEETPEFWHALGGQGSYHNYLDPDIPEDFEPTLYHCYITAHGVFKYEEISPFTQQVFIKLFLILLKPFNILYFISVGTLSVIRIRLKCRSCHTLL